MKCKSTALLFACLAVLFSLSFASAITIEDFTITAPANVSHDANSFTMTFVLNNTGASGTVNLTNAATSGSYTLSFSQSNPITLNANQTSVITATLTFPKHQTSSLAGTITANPSGAGTPKSASFSIPVLSANSLSIAKIRDLSTTQNASINVTNTGNTQLSNINLSASGTLPVKFSTTTFSLGPGQSQVAAISLIDASTLIFGTNTLTVQAKDLITNTAASDLSLDISKSFCVQGKQGGNLSLRVDIESNGKDDLEWKALDIITVDVDVEYKGNKDDSVEDVIVELGLFDSTGRNIIDDVDFENTDNEKIELNDLDSGDDVATATFTFKVPADIDSGNYKLAVKAYGDGVGETKECVDLSTDLGNSFYQKIKVSKENDDGKFIAFQNIKISPVDVTCGDTVTMTFDIYNVGNEDQNQVLIMLQNKELGIDLSKEIKNDLNQGDKETISFTFIVPAGLQDKLYNLELSAKYDFSRDTYREMSDEKTIAQLKVFGCGVVQTPTATSITAALDSEAKAGKELVVKATITNKGAQAKNYVIEAVGYENWAKLNSISERLITLPAGQNKEVIFKFAVNSDASGQQTFAVKTQAGTELTTQQIAVNIGEGLSLFKGNTWLWVIGIVNIILIILIIIVAVRVASR